MAEAQVANGTDPVPPVFMPEAVRRAAARAEELMAAQNNANDDRREEQPAPQEAPPGSPEPHPAPQPEEPAEPEQPPPPSQEGAWEQRYRTLQGKYDTEISGLRAQVAGLERLLATMQAPPQPQPAEQPAAPHYNDEDVQLYGEDLLQAVTRAADARYQPIITRLEAQLAQLQGGQQNLAGQRLQDQVFDALDTDPELNGRWRPINTSQGFLNWLQQLDEFSGIARYEMLQHAYQSGDAMRTARFFKKYMAEHTDRLPAAAPAPAPAPARGNGHAAPATPRLADFAAPGRAAGTGQGNGAPQTRIWSRPEITAFYRDRTSGKFRGRQEESERLEQDIIAAAREGRIH